MGYGDVGFNGCKDIPTAHIKEKKRKTYAAMVSAVDGGVGELLATLRELEIDDNSLIFFLSDNGGPEKKNGSDNGELRGDKGDVWVGASLCV